MISFKNAKILIVDDRLANIDVLKGLLQMQDYTNIETLSDSRLFFDIFKSFKPDLILLDLMMPYVSGFEIMKTLKDLIPDTVYLPILVLTADISEETKQRALAEGAKDFLAKPFDLIEVSLRIENLLFTRFLYLQLQNQNQILEEKIKERTFELVIAKEKAEESNRLKTVFLNNLSHELRTPMNGILGFINILKKPELEEEKKEKYIEIVNISAERLLDTMDELVVMSRIEAGDNMLHITSFDLNQEIYFQYAFFKPKADKKGIQLLYNNQLEGNASIIKSDKIKISSMLINLVNNAIKFTNKGTVEFGNYLENGNLVIFVKDTGAGIPANRLEAIFDRFVQADTRLTREHEGLGLGLSITKAYIDALGGKIAVVSEQGQYTVFTVTLPYNT